MSSFDPERFLSEGYQIVENAIAAETVATVAAFLEQQLPTALETIRTAFPFADVPDLVRRIADGVADGTLPTGDHTLDQLLSGHFPLDTRLSECLWEVPRSAGLKALLQQIFPGQSLRMHMPPAARFVLPGNLNAGVPRHQDISYNKHMENFVTVWVPFTAIDAERGGVAVDTGSNRLAECPTEPEGFWLETVHEEKGALRHCLVPPGGVLLLTPLIVHQSMPNRSDRPRLSVDYRFFGSATTSSKHSLDLDSFEVFDGQGH